MSTAKKDIRGILGLGAVVCAACCAGPILAFLGGLGLAGLASTVVIGAAGVVIAAIAAAELLVVWRRRGRASCPPDRAEPVAVGPPTRKLPVR